MAPQKDIYDLIPDSITRSPYMVKREFADVNIVKDLEL